MKPKYKKPKSLDKRIGEYIEKTIDDPCKSCGVPWHEHLGISGTCAKLEEARLALSEIKKRIEPFASWPANKGRELNNVVRLCDKTLEAIK